MKKIVAAFTVLLSCSGLCVATSLRKEAPRPACGLLGAPAGRADDAGVTPLFLTEENSEAYASVLPRYLGADSCLLGRHSNRTQRLSPWQSDVTEQHLHDEKAYSSCAVVGASPNTRGRDLGQSIDSHHTVFRAGICDDPTLAEHAADIGTRSTFCVSFTAKKDITEGAKLVLPVTQWPYLHSVRGSGLEAPPRAPCGDGRILFLHPRFMRRSSDAVVSCARTSTVLDSKRFVDSWLKDVHVYDPDCLAHSEEPRSCPNILGFSSGFDAVLLALQLCHDAVDVYGFDLDTSEDAVYGHLHENITEVGYISDQMSDHSHPFVLERRLLKHWADVGALRLHSSPSAPAKIH